MKTISTRHNMNLLFLLLTTGLCLVTCPSPGPVLAKPNRRTTNDIISPTETTTTSQQADASCDQVAGFSPELVAEIHSKAGAVNKIIDLVLNGDEKHSTYNELAYLCDTFGPRLSGSKALEAAINHMEAKMKASKLTLKSEKALIPKWEVHKQWAEMVEPRQHPMSILALGDSESTNNQTLEAEVVIVHSFKELDELGESGHIKGKIVVYNYNYTKYADSVKYREEGAVRASKYGAQAALVRSVTFFSIYSPHAGMSTRSIPTAAITLEDADLIQRITNRGQRVVLRLFIDSRKYSDVESRNVIGDIEGTESPQEIVLISGHIDSWYNTDGAMDDGGGMMISYMAAHVLSKLKLRAKRTIRAALWTCEEFGLFGVKQYFKNHKHELHNFKVVMESDLGTFEPLGLSVINVSPLGKCVVKEVLSLLESIGTTRVDTNYEGSDIEEFTDVGVPGMSLANNNSRYFYFHHTSGDAITMENPDYLDRTTILWAAASYVLADLDIELK